MTRREGKPKDYEVGYRKPPRGTQFQPGQSGNPKGRPKSHPSFRSLLEKQIHKKTKVRIGGKIKSMSNLEVGITRLIQILVQGKPEKMIPTLRLLLPFINHETGPVPQYDFSRLTDDEVDLMIRLYEKMGLADNEEVISKLKN